MYHVSHTRPAPAPLDFNAPRRTDSVADVLGPDDSLNGKFPVPALDTAALLTELGLSDRAIRETLTESPGPSS